MKIILSHIQQTDLNTDVLWNVALANHEMLKETNSMVDISIGKLKVFK
jgi:hypothetical protein